MIIKRVYVDHLRNVHLFNGLSRKDLEKIASRCEVVDVPAGRVLMHEGKAGNEAFVILKGKVAVRRNGRKVVELGEGAMVGELSLLDQGVRSATVDCLTDCQLLLITRAGLVSVIEEVPTMSRKLFASLAGRLRNIDGRNYV